MSENPEDQKPDSEQAFLEQARQRFQTAREFDAVDRREAEADNTFAYAEDATLGQWDETAVRARKKSKRPIVQWNRIPTFVQQVANDGRQNRPSIKITRGDDEATAETAEYFTGRIRQIEYDSNVDTAKDMARDQQITTGRGFLRVTTEWVPGTQKQRIRVDRIENQFAVVFDPGAREYDRSDADYCFVISYITRAEHIRRFGKETLNATTEFADMMREFDGWYGVGKNGDIIQIADYYHKEYEVVEVPGDGVNPPRKERVAKVYHCVIDGAQKLDETEWLGSTIPVVPVWGKEAVVDGRRRTYSLIRNARAPQRWLNLSLSNLIEQVGQQSKSPWRVAAGSIEPWEQDWSDAHVSPKGYLLYKQYDDEGRPYNKPERNAFEPAIQALVEACNVAIDGIKASMGIFDASIGAKSNETSGIAIQRRQKEADVANYHFPDNEARSNKYLGQILVELIGKLDKAGDSYPIRTEDGKTHLVPVGVEHQDWKTGQPVTHDLLSGQYGVTVSTGPSYTTQRQESYDRDVALVQAQPELMWVIGDLMFRADDSAGSEERADRMKQAIAMRAPGLIQDKQQAQIPPEVQQQFAQMQQELQQTQAFAQNLHEQLQTKAVERSTQVQIEQMRLAFEREKLAVDDQNKKLDIASREGIEELKQQIVVLQQDMQLMHERHMASQQHAVDAGKQAADQQHQRDMADQQAQNASVEAEAQREHETAQAERAEQQQAEME